MADIDWESEVAALLNELSSVQTELLQTLGEKRNLLVASDLAGIAALQPREQDLLVRLQQCQEHRARLLALAAEQGLPASNIRSLAAALPQTQHRLDKQFRDAAARSRLLEHESLTSWVLVQKTLIHLSQLLEIIATGGRLKPTYGILDTSTTSGGLVDQAA